MPNTTMSTLAGKATSRVKLQSLPPTPNGFAKQRLTPSTKSVRANYGSLAPEVACAMAESLCYAYASLSQPDFEVRQCGPHTERMLAQYVGRCLWTWDDVPAFIPPKRVPPLPLVADQPTKPANQPTKPADQPEADQPARPDDTDGNAEPPIYNPGEVTLYHCSRRLLPVSLNSTALFPADMRAVSPRLSCNLLLGSYNSVDRAVARWLAAAGIDHEPTPLAGALSLVGYGELQDAALPPFHRLPERVKRSGYSARQSLILDLAGADGVLPFSHAILRSTLYEDDLAKRLQDVRPQVTEKLQQLIEHIEPKAPGVVELIEEGAIPYEAAAERVVRGDWRFDLGVLDEGRSVADPDDDLLAITCRLIVASGTPHQFVSAETLLALAVLTGVSPAAYVRYAELDLARRGVTYLGAGTVSRLIALVREVELDGVAARRRDVLVRELALLEARLKVAEEVEEKRGEVVRGWMRTRTWRVVGEWLG